MNYIELKALIEKRGVHPVFGDIGEGWGIEQNPHELATFLIAMHSLGVQSCLEIGTGHRGGLSRFLAADMGWRVTTIDVVDYGHKFEGVFYITSPAPHSIVIHGGVDLVFIDGAHDYESVKGDYKYWGKYATKAIAFHDIEGLRDCSGVERFFLEVISLPPKKFKAVSDTTKKASGIGWLVL